jgi:hypothetical protein
VSSVHPGGRDTTHGAIVRSPKRRSSASTSSGERFPHARRGEADRPY